MELPKGWVNTTLESISYGDNSIVDGPFGSNLKTSDYIDDSDNGVPVLTTKNLAGDYSRTSVRYISQAKFEELKRSQVKGGDILVAKIGSIGKTGIYPLSRPTAIIPANLLKFTVNPDIVLRYVYYFLNFSEFQKTLKAISSATAQPAFNVTKFRRLNIPLPPLAEQERIVAKIDALFSKLDKGVETLQTIRQQLKTYRQAVLKWAFEGCELVELRKLAEAIDPQPSHRTPPEFEGGIPYVGIRECDYSTRKINFKIARKVSPDVLIEHINRYKIYDGDFIIGKIGTIGKPFLVPLEQNYTLSANIVLIQPNFEKTSKDYLFYAFQTQGVDIQLRKANSTTQAAFGIQRVRTLMMPLTSEDKKKQTAIVSAIESLLSVCDKLESIVEENIAKAEALRQSILKKAFSGQLVPQDPNDEPAEELLKRIKAEQVSGKRKRNNAGGKP